MHQALHSSVDGEEQIPYMDLFSDDPQFGQLLLQLRKQHLAEILDYGDSLESYLVAVPDMEAKLRNLNANLLAANMPLLSLRNALSQYDEVRTRVHHVRTCRIDWASYGFAVRGTSESYTAKV